MRSRLVDVPPLSRRIRVHEAGSGPPLVYLHGLWGVFPDDPLIAALAERHRVLAPMLPGFEDSTGEDSLRDILDFALHGFDVIESLGVERPTLVGHSLGGMIAAEMAAIRPEAVERLVLISPFGLWLPDHEIPDLFGMTFGAWPEVLFADPEAHATTLLRGADLRDHEALKALLIDHARTFGLASRILFPIPDRRLAERLPRITAQCLLIFGERDRLIHPAYADAFKARMTRARSMRIALLPGAAHMSVLEQPPEIARLVGELEAQGRPR